jgi:hypothetical protein
MCLPSYIVLYECFKQRTSSSTHRFFSIQLLSWQFVSGTACFYLYYLVSDCAFVSSKNLSISAFDSDAAADGSEQDVPTKSGICLAWEISHRFTGIALIGLAW